MLRRFEEVPHRFTVPPQAEAVSVARDGVARHAEQLGLAMDEDFTSDLKLLTGELIANSVTHTQAACEVRVLLSQERLRVEVTDVGTTLVSPTHAGLADESGRGLFLVDALATKWGSELREEGKVTWFELAVRGQAEHAAAEVSSGVEPLADCLIAGHTEHEHPVRTEPVAVTSAHVECQAA